MFTKEKSPFDVDLRCNLNIEVHVAMRLGDLIKSSGTDDKQLLALGHKLSNAMKYLADSLDDRQWKRFTSYIEEQSEEDLNFEENHYSSNARHVANQMPNHFYEDHEKNYKAPRTMRNIVENVVSK